MTSASDGSAYPHGEQAAAQRVAAAQQVYDEQESNARATAGTGPRDDDQANELADEAAAEIPGDAPAE